MARRLYNPRESRGSTRCITTLPRWVFLSCKAQTNEGVSMSCADRKPKQRDGKTHLLNADFDLDLVEHADRDLLAARIGRRNLVVVRVVLELALERDEALEAESGRARKASANEPRLDRPQRQDERGLNETHCETKTARPLRNARMTNASARTLPEPLSPPTCSSASFCAASSRRWIASAT